MKLISSCLLFVAVVTFITSPAWSQSDTTAQSGSENAKPKKKDKKVNAFIVPALASNPTAGFMYGISGIVNSRLGPAETTQLSDGMVAIIYTTKKQSMNLIKTNVFLKNDSWNLKGDWRLFFSSQPTFGLGTGPQSAKLVSSGIEISEGVFSKPVPDEQMMEFSYIRFHEAAMKRLGNTRFFAGLGLHYDYHYDISDHLLDLNDTNPSITSHYAYSKEMGFNPEKYTLFGLSLNGLYDNRDNPVNPYHGRYAYVSWRFNPEFMGSDKNSSILWLEYRDYFNLSKKRPRHMIAMWTYASLVTGGKVPYMDLPALGWDQFGKSGRGYLQGRFRGKELIYGELEYRVPLPAIIKKNPDLFGAVAFVNATTASNNFNFSTNNTQVNGYNEIKLFDYINPGYGIGLRVMVMKKSRANLTLDYAWGDYGSQGFYFNFNETF